MSLRIGQFATTCFVPRRREKDAELVDHLARGSLTKDLADHLGPSLSRQPAIVRIRRLPIRVVIPGPEFNEDSLSKAWTLAFSKALFTALAYPPGVGPFEVFRADSVAAFIAGAIHELLAGTAAGKWQYAEFEEIFRSGGEQAALALLCLWPHLTIPILLELAHSNGLDRLLARFDDLALEQIFAVLARRQHTEPAPLSIADLIAAAQLVRAQVVEKLSVLRSRRYALRLFVEARRRGEPGWPPRMLFHSLLAVAILLEESALLGDTPRREISGAKRLPAGVASTLDRLRREMQLTPQAPQLVRLNTLLSELRVKLKIPPPLEKTPEARWISSRFCGLFFLCSTLDGLGWMTAWSGLSRFQTAGISFLLAGLALSITEQFDPAPRALEAGLALFSGNTNEPDLIHLRVAFQEHSRDARLEVLRVALPREEVYDAAESWPAALGLLKDRLLGSFASRIRGFRQSSSQSVVRTFIERSGRIRVEPDRIVVTAEPSPFHVALRIAGMDAPVQSLSWLGGRRLEFDVGEL